MQKRNKLFIILLYLLIAVAVFIGQRNPPTEYELSIYFGEPLFTGLLFLAIAASAAYSLASVGIGRWLALGVTILGSFSMAAAHLIRGYYYYGHDE